MQHPVSKHLKEYLLLIRLPNVFTAPSNVLAGYFAAALTLDKTDSWDLVPLIVSSCLLYVAGIVLNDYFDLKIDSKERPFRPLPSGAISKKHALAIAIVSLLVANTMALVAGLTSLAVSVALTVTIISYDWRLKHSRFGPFAMGITRLLNVILGASPVLLYLNGVSYTILGTAAASMLVYVMAITILSKKEVGNEKPNSAVAFIMVFSDICAIVTLGLLVKLHWAFLLNLSIFAAFMTITFKLYLMRQEAPRVQKAVRNMVISIIVLDSIFISGTTGPLYGLTTLLLIVPSVVLAKKLYVT